jgi:hypothetical protein
MNFRAAFALIRQGAMLGVRTEPTKRESRCHDSIQKQVLCSPAR